MNAPKRQAAPKMSAALKLQAMPRAKARKAATRRARAETDQSKAEQPPRRALASNRSADGKGTPKQRPSGAAKAAPTAIREIVLCPRIEAAAIGSSSIVARAITPAANPAQPIMGRSAPGLTRRVSRLPKLAAMRKTP